MDKMISKSALLTFSLTTALLLGGCSWLGLDEEKKAPLAGERISVLELQKNIEGVDTTLKAEGFVSAKPWQNDFWTQAGGYPSHNLQNVALSQNPLKKIWSKDIGAGKSDGFPLTAQPVVFNGMVATVDSESNITLFEAATGKTIWENNLRPEDEDENVIGGGIAMTTDFVYATNGYGELLALDTRKGDIVWRVKLTAPSRAGPTVIGDKIYVLSLDNNLTALNTATGNQLWKYEGFSESAGLVKAASPAADNTIVIAPMSSGELTALRPEDGSVAWTDSLSPSMQTGGVSSLPDIAALPIIDNGMVFAVSYGGKIVSIDQATGQRIWTRDIGGAKDPWVSGNMIFFISSNAELVALGRDSGALAWVKSLSSYDNEGKSDNSLMWNGPIMAGDRLIVLSAGESLLEISPKDGSLINKKDLGFHVSLPPVVAGQTLYLVSDDGTLSAWK
jgi:outer membrane protein assembly factor BamB